MNEPKEKSDYLDNVEEIKLDEMEKYMDLYKQVVEVFKLNKVTLFDSYVVISSMSSALLQEIILAGEMENL